MTETTPASPESETPCNTSGQDERQLTPRVQHNGPVPGCMCYGANTPELDGNCPCQGVDLRP